MSDAACPDCERTHPWRDHGPIPAPDERQEFVCPKCQRSFASLRGVAAHKGGVCFGGTWQERFWAKVDRRGPDECWEWQASASAEGYGSFRKVAGPRERAHRIAYELLVGPIPDGLLVLHRCDNPPCVNPAHLFLGTVIDNNRDRDAKGRTGAAVGERAGTAKLTEADVRRIRELLASGQSQRAIAREYHIHQALVSGINTGRYWRHVR